MQGGKARQLLERRGTTIFALQPCRTYMNTGVKLYSSIAEAVSLDRVTSKIVSHPSLPISAWQLAIWMFLVTFSLQASFSPQVHWTHVQCCGEPILFLRYCIVLGLKAQRSQFSASSYRRTSSFHSLITVLGVASLGPSLPASNCWYNAEGVGVEGERRVRDVAMAGWLHDRFVRIH